MNICIVESETMVVVEVPDNRTDSFCDIEFERFIHIKTANSKTDILNENVIFTLNKQRK